MWFKEDSVEKDFCNCFPGFLPLPSPEISSIHPRYFQLIQKKTQIANLTSKRLVFYRLVSNNFQQMWLMLELINFF